MPGFALKATRPSGSVNNVKGDISMATMVIKRIGVLSLAKMQAMVMLVFGLLIGILYGLFFMALGGMMMSLDPSGRSSGGAAGGFIGGIMIMILSPIIYGILGFIAGAISALVYNAAAKFVGGIEMDLENVASPYGASPQYGAPPPPQQQPWGQNPY
jgi:hypothetical protein